MRMLLGLGVLSCIAAAAVAAPAPKGRPEKAPDITGEWVLTSLSVGGTPVPLADTGAVRIAVLVEFTADGAAGTSDAGRADRPGGLLLPWARPGPAHLRRP